MSAFVVEHRTMDRVLTLLLTPGDHGFVVGTLAGISLVDAHHDERTASKLGRALYAMNVAAVCGRYRDDSPENYADTTRYNFSPAFCGMHGGKVVPRAQIVAAFKSAECFLYQCSEDATVRWPLYAEVKDALALLAARLVHETPEYNKAEWG